MAGSWHVSHDGRGDWYPGSTMIAASDIESFRITSQGKTLATVPILTRRSQRRRVRQGTPD